MKLDMVSFYSVLSYFDFYFIHKTWPFEDSFNPSKIHFNSHLVEADPHSRADSVLYYVKETNIPRKIAH